MEWLGEGGVRLCRHGHIGPITLQTPIHSLPGVSADLVQHCASLSVHILGDILEYDAKSGLRWYTQAPFTDLAPFLPTNVPNEHTPLQIGQYWKLESHVDTNLHNGNIVRINGQTETGISVSKWYIPDGSKPYTALATHKPYTALVYHETFVGQHHSQG